MHFFIDASQSMPFGPFILNLKMHTNSIIYAHDLFHTHTSTVHINENATLFFFIVVVVIVATAIIFIYDYRSQKRHVMSAHTKKKNENQFQLFHEMTIYMCVSIRDFYPNFSNYFIPNELFCNTN